MRTRPMHTLHCSDHVIEIEGRHVGRVRATVCANGRCLYATIEWLDSGWVTENLDVRDLAFAPEGSH